MKITYLKATFIVGWMCEDYMFVQEDINNGYDFTLAFRIRCFNFHIEYQLEEFVSEYQNIIWAPIEYKYNNRILSLGPLNQT